MWGKAQAVECVNILIFSIMAKAKQLCLGASVHSKVKAKGVDRIDYCLTLPYGWKGS